MDKGGKIKMTIQKDKTRGIFDTAGLEKEIKDREFEIRKFNKNIPLQKMGYEQVNIILKDIRSDGVLKERQRLKAEVEKVLKECVKDGIIHNYALKQIKEKMGIIWK